MRPFPPIDRKLESLLLAIALGLLLGGLPAANAEAPIAAIQVVSAADTTPEALAGPVQTAPSLPAAKKLNGVLTQHLGKPATEDELGLLADLVVDHLKRHHWPVSLVTVWDEDDTLKDGRVTLQVQQGKLGDIAIVGGSKRRQMAVAKRLSKMANTPLNALTLQRQLDGLAFSSWLASTPQIGPGASFDTANLLLTLRDESPIHVFATYDNNGVEPLGRNRYSLGLQWLNAFALGHDLTVMGTIADDPETLTMFSGTWRIPLPWKHEIRLNGYYAETNSIGDVLGIPIEINGVTWQASPRYVIPWRLSERWRSEWQLGYDYKRFDTGFTFGSTTALTDTTGVGEIVLGSQWFYDADKNHLRLGLEVAHGQEGWAEGHEQHQFEHIVPGADPNFTIVRGDITYQHDFKNEIQTALRLGAQWSDGLLLPSEELSLASINAVRGYPERSFRASRGAWASVELRTPEWELAKSNLKFRFLAFADGGYKADDTFHDHADHEHQENSPQAQNQAPTPETIDFIASAGVGVRLEVTQHLHLRCDCAFPLLEREEPRVHVAAVVRF